MYEEMGANARNVQAIVVGIRMTNDKLSRNLTTGGTIIEWMNSVTSRNPSRQEINMKETSH